VDKIYGYDTLTHKKQVVVDFSANGIPGSAGGKLFVVSNNQGQQQIVFTVNVCTTKSNAECLVEPKVAVVNFAKNTGSLIPTPKGHTSLSVWSVSPDGNKMIVGVIGDKEKKQVLKFLTYDIEKNLWSESFIHDDHASITPLAWSPNGSEIAVKRLSYAEQVETPTQSLVIMNLNTNTETMIASNVFLLDDAEFSPDGTAIAWSSKDKNGISYVFIDSLVEANHKTVFDSAKVELNVSIMTNLAWSKDGQTLAFGGNQTGGDYPNLWLLKIDRSTK
jgi:Tol biopolymer transport system component